MNRDRIHEHLAGLDPLVGQPPPMLTFVVLADGSSIAFAHDWALDAVAAQDLELLDHCRSRLRVFVADIADVDRVMAAVAQVVQDRGHLHG